MSTRDDHGYLIDHGTACPHVYDLGAGYHLAETVGPDGDRWPIICDERVTEPQTIPLRPEHFLADEVATHELGGPLPADVQARLDAVTAHSRPVDAPAGNRPDMPRCGRPRRDGGPCRTPVTRPGEACWNHRDLSRAGR